MTIDKNFIFLLTEVKSESLLGKTNSIIFFDSGFLNLPGYKVNSVNCLSDSQIRFFISSNQSKGACPVCRAYSHKKHSTYQRQLLDVPITGKIVRITLEVIKYFCCNNNCVRKVFTQRDAKKIKPYARRLERVNTILNGIAFEIGGNKGTTISHLISLPVSASTMLRIVARLPLQLYETPKVLDVDDWAYKRGPDMEPF